MDIQQSNEIFSFIKNIKSVNLYVLSNRFFVAFALITVGCVIGETSIAIAQETQLNVNTTTQNNITLIPLNSTEIELGSDDKPTIVTWLDTNGFEDNTPVINIDNQKFWKFFDPLIENIN
jgi:hypothetical protein